MAQHFHVHFEIAGGRGWRRLADAFPVKELAEEQAAATAAAFNIRRAIVKACPLTTCGGE